MNKERQWGTYLWVIIIGVLSILLVFKVIPDIKEGPNISKSELHDGLSDFLVCMDGCYTMLELIYLDIDYGNDTIRCLQSDCSYSCCQKNIGELGCFNRSYWLESDDCTQEVDY